MNIQLLKAAAVVVAIAFAPDAAMAVEVQAQLSRESIFLEESVDLMLRVEDAPTTSVAPKLMPLTKDFEILGQKVETHITLQDSKRNFSRSWIIEIRPRRVGRLVIPSIAVDGGSSAPIMVEVKEFRSSGSVMGEDVHLEVTADRSQPYVQSQVTITARLFFGERLLSGELSDPQVDNAIVQRIGKDRNFSTHRDGRDYQVIERRFSIFPELSGEMIVEQIRFTGLMLVVDQIGQQRQLHKQVTADPIVLQVRPKPREFTGAAWLPAKNLTLMDSWDEGLPDFNAGTPVNRRITVRADGVRAIQLLSPAYEENDTVRIYGSQADLQNRERGDRIVGELSEDFVLVPQSVDRVEIPPFRVVWWDIDEDREKVAELRPVSVALRDSPESFADSGQSGLAQVQQPDNLPIEPQANQQDITWKMVSFALALAWLVTICAFAWGRRRSLQTMEQQQIDERTERTRTQLRSAVRTACADGDAQAAASALIEWGQFMWPQKVLTSLIDLAAAVPSKTLSDELRALDRILYGQTTESWLGAELWREFSSLNVKSESVKENSARRLFDRHRSRLALLWPQQNRSLE